MTEQQFLDACDRVLGTIEDVLDRSGEDVDTQRSGHVLEIEFDDGSKVIVNGNAPVKEIWVAARSGGYHFRHDGTGWVDTRSNEPLSRRLTDAVARQGGFTVEFPAFG